MSEWQTKLAVLENAELENDGLKIRRLHMQQWKYLQIAVNK